MNENYSEKELRMLPDIRVKKYLIFGLMTLFTAVINPYTITMLSASETTLKALDLEVVINSTWTGCHSGGYWPVRVRTVNRGPKRTISYSISSVDTTKNNLNVNTTMSIDRGVTLDETILIPMVSDNTYMNFKTTVNNQGVNELGTTLNLESSNLIPATPAILLVNRDSSGSIKEMEEASAQIQTSRNAGSTTYYSSSSYNHNVAYVAGYTQNLPATWLGYSGLDVVICDVDTFVSLQTQRQEAIISWVQSGGNLLLYQKDTSDEVILSTTAKFSGAIKDMQSAVWTDFRGDTSQAFRLERDPATGDVTQSPARTRDFNWPIKDHNLRQVQVMLGHLTWVPFDLTHGTISDWSWLMQDNQLKMNKLSDRTAVHSRGYNTTFGSFNIPGIQSVPVTSFLVLITAFTIIIGPLNYIYFLRKKQLAMLLVSIPVLAFSTSILLILYATIAHGFSVKGRLRSLMVVDQQLNKSVTLTRSALYAGQAPAKLKFSPETAVFPVWPQQNGFERGNVDWSGNQQLMQGNWIRSRTRTQFYSNQVKNERGRINVEAPLAGKLPISNGFEFDLELLVVIDSTGDLYIGKNIAAGNSADLTPVNDPAIRRSIAEGVKAKFDNSNTYSEPPNPYSGYGRRGYDYSASFSQELIQSQAEKFRMSFADAIATDDPDVMKTLLKSYARKSYVAILKTNNQLDLGVNNVKEQESSHVLIGKY